MAYFRPDKSAENRSVFNWAHRLVGLLTYTCSGNFQNKIFLKYLINSLI